MENNAETLEQQDVLRSENEYKEELPQQDANKNKVLLSLNLNHLAVILSNLAIFTGILSVTMAFGGIVNVLGTFIIAALLFCFLIVITFVTLGVIYLTTNIGKMWGWFEKLNDNSIKVNNFIYSVLPYVAVLAFAICVASLFVLVFLNKQKKVSRIVASCIFAFLTLLISIFYFAGVLR